MDLKNFLPAVVDSELDSITEDDIITNQNQDGEQQKQVNPFDETRFEKPQEDLEKSKSDELETDDPKLSEDDNTTDVDSFTQAEALVELLNTEGLQIYNEIPKGLTMEQFVKDIPEYISSIESEIRRDESAKLGKFQEYYEMMVNGISGEDLKPAMMLENIVDLDLDAPNMTTADLIDVIKTKHLLRGLSDNEATALANLNAKNVEVLKQESLASQQYVADYIENIKQDVVRQKESEQEQQKAQFEAEQRSFIDALNQSTQYTKEQKKEFFDMRYKRDQQVSWTDSDGNMQRDFVTKYDLLMHQIQTDPRKLLDIIEYMSSGFDLKKAVKNDVATEYTKKLFAKLEGNTIIDNTSNSKRKEIEGQSRFNSVTF